MDHKLEQMMAVATEVLRAVQLDDDQVFVMDKTLVGCLGVDLAAKTVAVMGLTVDVTMVYPKVALMEKYWV